MSCSEALEKVESSRTSRLENLQKTMMILVEFIGQAAEHTTYI